MFKESSATEQLHLLIDDDSHQTGRSTIAPLRSQFLKWIGNKQRFAPEIVSYFPPVYSTYYEPFIGSGAVLATLAPQSAVASDILPALIEIWQTLAADPERIKEWYEERWNQVMMSGNDRVKGYETIKASYNKRPNGADFLFITRSCYGGVVRFRIADGYLSTPCGAHSPISPEVFAQRVDHWHPRVQQTKFVLSDFESVMNAAESGSLIYCDPPYTYSQAIVYGAQAFSLERLLACIARAKERGVYVALSIDGTKKSGNVICGLPIPKGLFEREVSVKVGRSMLRRFQKAGKTLEDEVVQDRLLLTY